MIQETYDSHRAAFLKQNKDALQASPPVRPEADKALLAHLAVASGDVRGRDAQEVNCMVIWARPPPAIITAIKEIQKKIREDLGGKVWLVPEADIHLSVLELSHQHSVPHLRSVLSNLGAERLKTMLSVPSALDEKPALVRPQLGFDKRGFALNVVPSAATKFTYHHLRADLQRRALESGIEIDTCYTALSAHVTIARFLSGDVIGSTKDADRKFVELVDEVNKSLQNKFQDVPEGDSLQWQVDSLELQLGYLKFGRGRSEAEYIGG